MGHQSKINKANKEMEKDRILAEPGMEVYKKLQAFYKLHPTSTPAVSMEVKKIRDECAAFEEALKSRFEVEHSELLVAYMQKELDYVQSYLSPEQVKIDAESKAFDTMMGLEAENRNRTINPIFDPTKISTPKLPKKEGGFKRFIKSVMP